jgi:phosphoglycerate dehydrogenase-like enzyme
VPPELCQPGAKRGIVVTNLSDLYGAVIAEHALAMMLMLSRNLHLVVRNQQEQRWDKGAVAQTMSDLHGKTAAIIGAGNIGQEIARLGRALGMRIVGCRRTDEPAAYLDRLYPPSQLGELLGEADYVIVAAPLTRQTEGMLGRAEFAAMKRGVFFINVSRGAIADEAALLAALRSGHVAGAGLDAFAVEPLPVGHPFWSLPQVIVSPHYSGETVNLGPLPGERFARNLRCWQAGKKLEGMVDLQLGY